MSNSVIGIITALGATASWALCSVVFKKIGEKLEPMGMTAVKALASVVFLLPLVFFLYGGFALSLKHFALLAISGIIGVGIGDSFFFATLSRLSPLALAILLLAAPDVFSGVLGVLCLGEMPAWQVWCGIVSIMLGIGFLLFPLPKDESGDSAKTTLVGILFGLISMASTAVSMVIIKPVLPEIPSLSATMWRMLFGGLALLVYGCVCGKLPEWSIPFRSGNYRWHFLGAVALVTFGGFWLSLLAVSKLDLVVASALMSLEPLFVLPFMILFGKHKVSVREIIGMAASVAGVLLITFYSK